jgi:hypothetical protein
MRAILVSILFLLFASLLLAQELSEDERKDAWRVVSEKLAIEYERSPWSIRISVISLNRPNQRFYLLALFERLDYETGKTRGLKDDFRVERSNPLLAALMPENKESTIVLCAESLPKFSAIIQKADKWCALALQQSLPAGVEKEVGVVETRLGDKYRLVLRTPDSVFLERENRFPLNYAKPDETGPVWARIGELNSPFRKMLPEALDDAAKLERQFPSELQAELQRRRAVEAKMRRNERDARSQVDAVLK